MITGHLGIAAIAYAVSRTNNSRNLFLALLAASVAPDVVDVVYTIFAICNPSGLYSHTTYAVALEAGIICGLAYLATRSIRITLLFLCVISLHPAADYFTGSKLFVPGGEIHGLRLYWRPELDFLLECAIAATGWAVLARSNRGWWAARSRSALAILVATQAVFDGYALITEKSLKPNSCKEWVQGTASGRSSGAAPFLTAFSPS